MKGLTTALLDRACRIYLERAYPEGISTIPHPNNTYGFLRPDQPLEGLLVPPLCQPLSGRDGSIRGYSLRLGSACHPHLKLQIVSQDQEGCVFCVDTHDTFVLDSADPDCPRWNQLQMVNRRLKEHIERAWEDAGLLTFNSLLRRELSRP